MVDFLECNSWGDCSRNEEAKRWRIVVWYCDIHMQNLPVISGAQGLTLKLVTFL
jgi:hypothetical protein